MKFKIFRVVSPLSGGKEGTLVFPPISVGILTRHARNHSFEIDQDDLHRRWYSDVAPWEMEKLRGLAEDEQRMWKYLEMGKDPDWEWFGERVVHLSDFSTADMFLFSMISSDLGCCVASLAFMRFLKDRFARPIIMGGEYYVHAPIYDEIERVLLFKIIDYYILGYGEEPLERLLTILSGRPTSLTFADVPGLCYLENGEICRNSYGTYHPLVIPDFEGMPLDLYKWSADCTPPGTHLPPPKDELTLPFHFSTGCPYNCAFCDASGIKKMGTVPVEKAVAALKGMVEHFGCRTFFFLDDTFNFSPKYVKEFCDRIIDAGLDIHWMTCASPRGMDIATLKKMREAGAVRIVWGLESGSNRLLEYVHKPTSTIERATEVYAMSHEAGIWNGVECIVGLPSETEAEFEATLHFFERHADILDEVWSYQFYLNAISEMFTNPEPYGITNIRRVNFGLTKDTAYASVAASHIFDERDGLRWHDKEEQQKRRHGLTLELLARLRLYPMTWEHEQQPNLLSWCYRHCRTKAEVRSLYHVYWQKLALHRTWAPAGLAGDTPEEVAAAILRKYTGKGSLPEIAQIWQACYPDKWVPTYTGEALTAHVSYERLLLTDGRFHDQLVYSKLKEMLGQSLATTGDQPSLVGQGRTSLARMHLPSAGTERKLSRSRVDRARKDRGSAKPLD